jgi:putative membrane protein
MIEHYSDHAANERTFLAWVRTAIALMAFGFLIERFDIFLAAMNAGLHAHPISLKEHRFADDAGLAFILIGVAMIVVAAVRFFRIGKQIDDSKSFPGSDTLYDFVLAALLVLLGLSLFLYLAHVILPQL